MHVLAETQHFFSVRVISGLHFGRGNKLRLLTTNKNTHCTILLQNIVQVSIIKVHNLL